MQKCVTFLVYMDYLIRLEISLRRMSITQNTIIDQNPFLIVALENSITTNWYDTNSYAGLKIDTIRFQFDLYQLMKQYI